MIDVIEKNNSNDETYNDDEKKNIIYILKTLPGFSRFIKHNNLDNDCLLSVVPFIKHIKIKRGFYIFRQGNVSKEFFCVLKGKVSLRVKKTHSYKNIIKNLAKNKNLKLVQTISKL